MKTRRINLKICNYISAACFFLAAATLLFIPLISSEDGFPGFAYFLAGLFWLGHIAGGALQIFLWIKTRKTKTGKSFRKAKLVTAAAVALSVIFVVLAVFLLKTNEYALSITLFVMLLSVESFCVIKRMEKVDEGFSAWKRICGFTHRFLRKDGS